jgi:hypothetical protein
VATESLEPRAKIEPTVTYLSVRGDPEHEACYAGCLDLAEIRVDLGRVPETPIWLFVRSQASPYQNNEWQFGPELRTDIAEGEPDNRREWQISVNAPNDNPCVDIGIYDIDGQALFEEQRCQPDRCAVYGARFTNLCNMPPRSLVDATRIAADSCDDPPHLEEGSKSELIYPAITPPKSARKERLPDCSALPPAAASSNTWAIIMLALAACWSVQRRRRPLRGQDGVER